VLRDVLYALILPLAYLVAGIENGITLWVVAGAIALVLEVGAAVLAVWIFRRIFMRAQKSVPQEKPFRIRMPPEIDG